MTIRHILDHKGGRVVTLSPETTVIVAAHRLRLDRIGAIVIIASDGRVEGILSERDIVHGLAEHGGGVGDLPVAALMTRNVHTCGPDADIRDVMRLMTQHRVRHVPVVENGRLMGIVSIGDVVKSRVDSMELEANVLHDYFVAHQ